MAKVRPYHTINMESPPDHRDVYHDHDDCKYGKKILEKDKAYGTDKQAALRRVHQVRLIRSRNTISQYGPAGTCESRTSQVLRSRRTGSPLSKHTPTRASQRPL